MKIILHTVDISASPETVYGALSTGHGLAGWWSTRVDAGEKVGGIVRFSFIPVFNPEMEITALDPPRLVAWKCIAGHEPWIDNTFQFNIEPRGAGVVLFFRQEYSRELSDEEYGRYNFNWGYYLNSLKKLCQTGHGTPYGRETSDDKKAVVERFVDEYNNKHNTSIVDDLIAEDCSIHLPFPGLPQGREGMRANGQLMCSAFPDVSVKREFLVAEGDIVVERASACATHKAELMGTKPTGKSVTWTELHAYRVRDGQIHEIWSEANFMGVMGQIGAVQIQQ